MFKNDMHQIALDLLAEFGDSGTLQQITQGEYDPETGERPESIVEVQLHYVQENFSLQDIDTGLVASSDLKVTFATPTMDTSVNATNNLVLYTGTVTNLTDIKPVTTQNGIVIYECTATTQVA